MARTPAAPARSTRRFAAALLLVVLLAAAACGGGGDGKKAVDDAEANAKRKAYSSAVKDAQQSDDDSDLKAAEGATTTTTVPGQGGTTAAPSTAPTGGTTAAPTTKPGATTPATVPPQQAADQAKVLPDDLPAGASGVPASGLYAAILPCLSGAAGADRPAAQADGDHFTIGAPDSSEQALSTTAVFPSVEVAKAVTDAASTPQFGQCVTSAVVQAGQIQGASGGPLVLAQGLPARGDQSVWFRGALGAADPSGGDVPLPVDALVAPIRTGRTVSFLVLVGTGSKVDQWMITDLSQGIADRQR